MPKFLFRSRWFALGWVMITLASIGAFFSENGGHTRLDDATDTIREQQRQMDELAQGGPGSSASTAPAVLTEEASDEPAPDADPAEAAAEGSKTVRLVKASAAEDEDAPPADEGDTYVVVDKGASIPEAE